MSSVANQDENKEPDDVRIDSVTDGPSWPAASNVGTAVAAVP